MKCFRQKHAPFWLLVLIALIYGLIQSQMPHHAFWSNDGGQKLVQVQSLIRNGLANPEIPYDFLDIEPPGAFDFAPFYPGHARIAGEKLLSVVPIYFPLLSVAPFLLMSHAGLYLIPILAALAILYCLTLLSRTIFDHPVGPLAVAGAGLSSSLFFYSLVFFEHTLAACLFAAGLTLLITGRNKTKATMLILTVASGLVMSMGVWFRGDVYFVLFGILAGMLFVRACRQLILPFIAGLVLGLAPYFLINHLLYGTFIGSQVAFTMSGANTLRATVPPLGQYIAKHWDITRYFLLTWIDLPMFNWVFLLATVFPALLLSAGKDRQPNRRDFILTAWCAVLCCISLTTLGRLFFLGNPMQDSMSVLGLFGAIPFLGFAFVRIRGKQPNQGRDFLFIAMLAALLGYSLGLPSHGGLQWGPRYLLPLYPVMILLAAGAAVELRKSITGRVPRKIFTAMFALMLVSGCAIQLFGVKLLFDKKTATSANIEEIKKTNPSVIITDTWWVPEDNGALYFDVPMYTFYTTERMNELLMKLAQIGENEVVFVSAADQRKLIARHPKTALISFSKTEHPRTRLFNLYIHKIRLRRS